MFHIVTLKSCFAENSSNNAGFPVGNMYDNQMYDGSEPVPSVNTQWSSGQLQTDQRMNNSNSRYTLIIVCSLYYYCYITADFVICAAIFFVSSDFSFNRDYLTNMNKCKEGQPSQDKA